MKARALHNWQVSVAQAQAIQLELAPQVLRRNELVYAPRFVAGVDISARDARGMGRGAVVVLSYPELALAEVKVVEQKVDFPYVPGLLSFREAPVAVAAFEKLDLTPDLILVDAQGIAHPRRFGFASHLGLLLDTPAIGCAKSILCGRHEPLASEAGAYAELIDNGEVVGASLRTKGGVTPIYVSIGHKVDLDNAIKYVMACCRGYRIPEPTRLAHLAAGGRIPEGTVMRAVSQDEHAKQLTVF